MSEIFHIPKELIKIKDKKDRCSRTKAIILALLLAFLFFCAVIELEILKNILEQAYIAGYSPAYLP